MYNYLEAVKDDVRNMLTSGEVDLTQYADKTDAYDMLYDALWIDDSVTGNGSGSYTFDRWQAKEYVTDSDDGMETFREAVNEYGIPNDEIAVKFLDEDWEYVDVTIRCYLLGEALGEVLNELMPE